MDDTSEIKRGQQGSDNQPTSSRFGNLLAKTPYLGFLGFLEYLDHWWPPFAAFELFYLFFLLWLVLFAINLFGRRRDEEPAETLQVQPGVAVRYLLASFLSLLNPFVFMQSLLHSFGQVAVLVRLRGQLPSPVTRVAEGYRPPFRGTWTVAKGGVDPHSSHSWGILNQRFAYDFYVTDERGQSHRGSGERLEDYYAFGREVVAPKDGVVVAVRDGIRDFPHPGRGWIDFLAWDFRGNWVTIRHAADEYSFIAHFRRGSIRVRPGQTVRAGEVLGLCGNSGHSTEPHIHFHVQDRPNFYWAAGLPVRFGGDFLKTGDRVSGFDALTDAVTPNHEREGRTFGSLDSPAPPA